MSIVENHSVMQGVEVVDHLLLGKISKMRRCPTGKGIPRRLNQLADRMAKAQGKKIWVFEAV